MAEWGEEVNLGVREKENHQYARSCQCFRRRDLSVQLGKTLVRCTAQKGIYRCHEDWEGDD